MRNDNLTQLASNLQRVSIIVYPAKNSSKFYFNFKSINTTLGLFA